MGKTKTTVDKQTTTTVQTKIVKFSYLETLAVDNGLATAKSLAGETEASTLKIDENTEKKDFVTRGFDAAHPFGDPLGNVLGRIDRSLFGKKTTSKVEGSIKDSGWSLVKTWNEPQFDVIRYAIGIKELTASHFNYESVSEFISKSWTSPKEITKVALYVDQIIPAEFPAGGTYIEFYVKPDIEEAKWIRINGVSLPTVFNSDGTIVPRIVSFNTERPVNTRLEESYVFTDAPVKSLRFKAILKRPQTVTNGEDATSFTPVLKSYKLIMTPKGGL